MTRSSTPPILVELQNPGSVASQIAALRALKNEIVGHDQKKEAWIGYGIVPLLSRILASRKGSGKRKNREINGTGKTFERRHNRSEEDEACLQAIIVVGCLAQGGSYFVPPILAGNILPPLLFILSSKDCPQSLILTILKTLNTIADILPLERHLEYPRDKQLANLLFSRDHIGSLVRILSQSSSSSSVQQSIALAASLVAKTCLEEGHKVALADSGVLDALALRLASSVVSQGFVLPGAENYIQEPGSLGYLPPPAPPKARLAPVLQAIAGIIEQSKSRADHLLSSPAIVTVFPKQPPDFSPTDIKKGPWGSYLSGFAVPRQSISNPIDALLPSIPAPQAKSTSQHSSNFPPLGSQGLTSKNGSTTKTPLSFIETASSDLEEDESALVSWLVHVVRAETVTTRLMAARLITILFRLGLVKKKRISMFGLLLVPLLVRMLDKEYEVIEEVEFVDDDIKLTKLCIKEEAPAILAALVMDTPELQKAAVDAHAIKKLSQLLKESYNPVSDMSGPPWRPEHRKITPSRQRREHPECHGIPGVPPMVKHVTRFREGILRALAAIAPFKDEYRKSICENGVVPYIIDSLKPYVFCEDEKSSPVAGNPTPTLLAACGAARALTRSVSVLRTSLIDAGVGAPLFALLKYRDVEVQIAASSVICNLALDFSPMKEAVIGAGILKTLCEHAHSSNARLRLESVWALKHLVYNATNDIKMNIVDELGPDWLKMIISSDSNIAPPSRRKGEDDAENGHSIAMGTPNSFGEQVDLLNPQDEDDSEDLQMADSVGSLKNGFDASRPSSARRRQLALNGDLDHTKQARRDDIAVQEQTLDLIRNLICGSGAGEMIDFLLKSLGENDLFEMLADKLRPKTISLSTRKESKTIPVPAEIILAVTYVLMHFAAGLPRQRQLLVSQRELLRLILPLFPHSNRNVRVNCAWIVINLTYEDDQSDHMDCRARAHELKNLGFLEKLAGLQEDSDLDVRERTKTALHLMGALLRDQT